VPYLSDLPQLGQGPLPTLVPFLALPLPVLPEPLLPLEQELALVHSHSEHKEQLLLKRNLPWGQRR